MNIIFTLVLCLSTILLIINNPDAVLSAFLSGGESALNLSLKLIVVYAIWLGIFEILRRTKLDKKLSKLLKPINKLLFGQIGDNANDYISMNLSANMLGISGATTPLGINAISELEKEQNSYYKTAMFFVLNATSVQILPSSVIALRTSMGSASSGDIIIPTLLSTLVSTIVGIILVKIFIKKSNNV